MAEEKTNVYPYRPPKKYPKKDLHGRPRVMQMQYKDFKRFQKFYVNVFGWDMFELPETAGGAKRKRVSDRGRGDGAELRDLGGT